MQNDILVVKADGRREAFSEAKLRRSIQRAGIPHRIEEEVVDHVRGILFDDIPTQEIYGHIREFLGKSKAPGLRGRFSLKQAIMELGPSGFPFERYVARILEHHGYQTQTGVVVAGRCVEHEVDVIAQRGRQRFMIECKFHNRAGSKSDVKVALYVQARFEDLKQRTSDSQDEGSRFDQPWLVTNTKFTSQAVTYGDCVGMKVLGWSHPPGDDLQHLIETPGLHPITCLLSLNAEQRRGLLQADVVLCQQLITDPTLLGRIGLSAPEQQAVVREASLICRRKPKRD